MDDFVSDVVSNQKLNNREDIRASFVKSFFFKLINITICSICWLDADHAVVSNPRSEGGSVYDAQFPASYVELL